MKSIQKIIYATATFLSLILVLCLKSIPSGQLWKNYNILYVPVESDDAEILNALEQSKIQNVVSYSKQFLPVMLGENSPEIAMYKINRSNPDFEYIQKRNAYFFDKSNKYRLYYIPSEHKNMISNCISLLEKKGIHAGVDLNTAYPWFLPVICVVIAIILALFSVNRYMFLSSCILPVVFVFCNPFYPAALSNILIQLSLFFTSNIWKRKKFLKVLLTTLVIPVMIFLSLVSAFSCSVKSGFLFLICIAGVFSSIKCYGYAEDYFISKMIFVPVYIRSANRVSLFANKSKIVMRSVTGTAVILILLFVLTSTTSVNSHFAKLQLPAAKGFSEELPGLSEYSRWTWNVKAYPYRSLNKSGTENEIQFPRFVENNGKILESLQTMTYDKDFIDQSISDIDKLPFDSIEKVIKTQNNEIKPGYASINSYHIGIFGIIMNLLCLFVLLFIYISIIIGKGVKK